MIEGHGNNIYNFEEGGVEVDFSSNIAFNNHSQEIFNYLQSVIHSIANYPDPEARQLTQSVASMCGVSPEEVIITNGSAEAFYLVAHLLSRRGLTKTAITTPSFSEYEDSCRLYGHEISYITINKLIAADLSGYTSLWLGAPNNPDGYRIHTDEITQMAVKYPSCYFIIDRAYNELSQDEERDAPPLRNIITINSFTKAYSIPGLRLGYAIASPEIISELTTMRPPWSVNSLSLLAGEYIVKNRERLQPNCEELIGESKFLQDEISQIVGFRVTPSNCNFFLVECQGSTAAELQRYLLNNHRLLIRDAANFTGLTEHHFRVAAQQRESNIKLINALKEWR